MRAFDVRLLHEDCSKELYSTSDALSRRCHQHSQTSEPSPLHCVASTVLRQTQLAVSRACAKLGRASRRDELSRCRTLPSTRLRLTTLPESGSMHHATSPIASQAPAPVHVTRPPTHTPCSGSGGSRSLALVGARRLGRRPTQSRSPSPWPFSQYAVRSAARGTPLDEPPRSWVLSQPVLSGERMMDDLWNASGRTLQRGRRVALAVLEHRRRHLSTRRFLRPMKRFWAIVQPSLPQQVAAVAVASSHATFRPPSFPHAC
jgi:hypothetical protein